ncbi:hypothetical protein OIE66_36850 [Nonomuraea sp. NBC_01738]|uniref:hypothetical protein n=1 Tax=Nonomuraea sp. NBC_01738 TaxID=2976003 RepID=UPI002E0E08F1|nr:hypothetical protein OIE66_36850 [Nonomuraea sp. NBC_01738]
MNATQATPGRRARRNKRARGGSRVGGILAGLALAGAAIAAQVYALTPNEIDAPLTAAGSMGDEVDAWRFSVKADSVTTAKAVQTDAKTVPAEQFFLVVGLSATSAKEPTNIARPTLLTADGNSYTVTDKVDTSRLITRPFVQPGFWIGGYAVFEVPADALEGARIVLRLPGGGSFVEPYSPEAEIDLGIDEAKAKQLSSSPQDVYSLKRS